MTREEAIKIINCYDIGFYDLSGEKIPADKLAEAFDMAIEALSADAETKCIAQIKVDTEELVRRIKEEYDITDEWIPCSDRLPSDAKEVLVCMKNGWIDTASYRGNKKHWRFDATDVAPCDLILAWMPLPTPYKGGDSE